MAELEYGNRDNLFNMVKAHAPDGSLLDMSINLTEKNDLIRDMPSYPANGGRTHHGVRWSSLPTGTIISIGGGWSASFGDLQPYTANTCIMKSRYQAPVDALKSEGAKAGDYRRMQEAAHEEGMSQSAAMTLVYGTSATAPEKINGLTNTAPWNDLTETDYVYDMEGSSNLRSAWLMAPGLNNCHLIHPKGEPGLGLSREAKPDQLVTASDTDAGATGKRWDVITEFEWIFGIVVRDQRSVKRIVNIDSSLSAISTDLIRKILQARLRHNVSAPMGWFLYCDPLVYTQLVIMAGDKLNVRYSSDNPYRTELPMIGDIVIRRMDALDDDGTYETQLT
jgi:hypothetical protein